MQRRTPRINLQPSLPRKERSAEMRIRPSGWAWIGLAGYVVAIDALLLRKKQSKGSPWCSMSEGFGDALKHPVRRWPVILVWVVLSIHLFGVFIPDKFEFIKKLDPIGLAARLIAGKTDEES